MDSSVKSDVKEEYPKQSIEETDQNNGESVELQPSDVEVNSVRNDCESSDQKSVRFHKITNFFPVLKQEGRAKMCSSSLGDAKQNEILQKLAMSKESGASKQFSHVGSSSSLKASLCSSGVATALKSIPSSDSQHTLRKPSSLPLTRMVNLKMLDSVMKTSISKVLRTKMEASEGKRDLSERARMSLSGSSKDKMTVISEESLQICKQEAENTHLAHSLSVKHKMKAVISEKSDLKKENIINNNISKLEKSRECLTVDDELTEIHACSRARKSTPSHSAKSFTSTAGSKQSSHSTHFEITTQLINAASKLETAEQPIASEPTTLTLSSEPPSVTPSEPPSEPPSVTPSEPPSVTPSEPPSVTPSEPSSEPPSVTPSEPPSETASEPSSAASHPSLVASEPSATALHPLFEASELPSAALQPQTPQSITVALEPTTASQQEMGATSQLTALTTQLATSAPPAALPQSNSTTSGIVSRNQTVVHSLKVRKTKRRHFKGGTYNLYLSPAKKRKRTLKKHFDSSTSVRDDESSVGGTENGSFLDSEEENSLVSEDCYTPSEKSLPDEEPVSEPQCTSPILPTDKSSDRKTVVKNVVDMCDSESKCDEQPPDSIANPELEYVVKLEIDEVAAYDTIDLVSCEEVGDSNCKSKIELETGIIAKEECDYAFNEQSDNRINKKDNICEGNKIDFEIPLNNDYHHVKPVEMAEIPDAGSSCKITDEAGMKQPNSNINAGINKVYGEITSKSEDKERKDQSNECEKNSKSIEIFSPVVNKTINCEKFVDKISFSVSDSACVIPENSEKHGCCTNDISSEISVPAPNVIKSQDDAMTRSHDSDVSKDSPISTIATSVKSRQRIKRRFTDDIVDTDAGIMSLNSLPAAKKSKTEQQSDIIENFLSASSNSEAKGGPVTRVECVYDSKLPPVSNCTCQASPIEASIGKEETSVYCQAVDSIDDKLVGCCNPVLTHHLVRPSVKIPFTVMCEMHLWRLKHHHCCPGCGLFCSQGDFLQCSNLKESKKQIHLYHERCQVNQEDGQPSFCPHCGGMFEIKTVHLELHMPTPPTFYLSQRPLLVVPKARITFCKSIDTEEEDKSVPERSYTVVETGKVLSSVGLPVGPDRLQLEALLVTLGSEKTLSPRFSIEELYSTAKNGDVDKVLYMLALGFDPNTKYKEHENETPLHAAAAAGQLVIVHLLIQAGAVADPMNERLYTPLMLAAESNHKHVMLYLIRVGAQVDSKGEDGMTCLHLAARSGNLEMCKILMNSGKVNVNVQDDGGWTPIVWASEHKHFIVVKFLIERGADPNIRDNEENTGLHWSAFSGSVDICQIYLDMGCDVNAANEHGDTPLHIAARQDSYECIVLFLSRGGNVEALNKANESPTQCCIDQNSQTYMALNMNQLLKKITSQYQHKAEKILYRDICKGKEQNPIQCVNGVDEELSPSDFLYIVENCETSPINIDRTITSLQSCHCEDDCTSTNCTCATISFKCWYDKEGCLLPEFNMVDPPMIFECNRACFCWRNCNNRVLQHGITCRLQLFRTKGKGWGVRTLRDIPKGTFICEYIGELISDSEADQREDDSYLFDLDNRDGETYCLDARYYGNVSRFINHLCEPNLVPVKVFVDHQDLSFPRIAFFSSREIKAYEELGFDYGEKFWVIKYKWFTCGCGSLKCKYSKDTIHDTLANYYRRLKEEQGEDIEHVQTT